jgi:rfaE bifunctional protein kinase chain/domain
MNFLSKAADVKILVVGDIMLDRYWWGNVSRISPEAPVPVINLEKTTATAGGAANVAANIAGLRATPFLVGVIGNDAESELIQEVLIGQKVSTEFLIKSNDRPTTTKTRIVAHNQQIARVDREIKTDLTEHECESVWGIVCGLLNQVQIIIVSDYGKGSLTRNFLARLIMTVREQDKFILVDPKGKDFSKYKGATLLTPNKFEFAEICNLETYNQTEIEEGGQKLISELALEYLLVTQGEEGMTLIQNNKAARHLHAESRNVYDVTGAGDTVISSLAVAIGNGFDILEAAKFANQAAGLVVEQVGTTTISLQMLEQL